MIQVVTNNINKYEKFNKELFVISKIYDFESFDNFDITVIDISDEKLWYNKDIKNDTINQSSDFKSIKSAILKSKKNSILVVFPQNIYYYYNYTAYNFKYNNSKRIKDMESNFVYIVDKYLMAMNSISINFGKSWSIVKTSEISSDFSFVNMNEEDVVLKAKNGNDVVIIKNNQTFITTLNIISDEDMVSTLQICFPKCFDQNSIAPEWARKIDFFTDKECKNNIAMIDKNIEKLEKQKNKENEKLKINNRYKSILYETGDYLAKQVNDILCKILEYDMSDFEDKYEEDGYIKLADITFIIETKGFNHELKGEDFIKAFNHLVVYEDGLEKNSTENVKCLFIIAAERTKNPNEREKIKNRQVTIARSNKTLIIETQTLLKIFEDFLNKKISSEEIKVMLKDNVGVLEYK